MGYPSEIHLKINSLEISYHELFLRSKTIGQSKMAVTDE